jgi:YD repeat-containing protein
VTITISSDAGQLSKRAITFQNVSRGSGNTAYYKTGTKQYFQFPFTDKQYIKDWEIGLPLVTTDYDKEDRILSRAINTYSSLLDNTSAVGKVENMKKLSTASNSNLTTVDSEAYRPYTGISLLTKTVIQKFIDNSNAINDTVTYSYDGKNNLALTTTRNSKGEYFQLKNVYNYDVSGPGVAFGNQPGTPLYNMTSDGIELKVSTERWKGNLLTQPSSAQLYDASITGYRYTNGKLWTKKLHGTETLNPLTYTTYRPAADPYTKILTAYNTTQVMPSIQLESEVIQYDAKGSPVETQLKGKDVYKAMIWDTITGNKVAEVMNARLQDIGFTSFESTVYGASYTGNETITNGGFTYKHWGVTLPADPVTGKAVYKLVNGGPASTITSPVLTSGKKYILTFWSKENAPTLAGAGLGNIVFTSHYSNGTWTQWKTEFTASQNAPVIFTFTGISPQSSYIDEIRLFPAGSVMTNSCYTPLFGASSVTDARGRITYYEYDVFGRNTVARDQEGNIISKQEYHIGQ